MRRITLNSISLIAIFIGIVLISCGGKEENTDISVNKYFLTVSPSIELLADGQTTELTITSNCRWNIVKDADWLTVSPTSGMNSQNVSITAGKNETKDSRVAVITIKGESELERKVTVTQLKKKEETPKEPIDMDGLYSLLRGMMGRRYNEAQALSSDEWIGLWGIDDGVYAQCSLHNFTSTNHCIQWYDILLNGIDKANKIITNADASKENIAQARTLRAYFTWILMDSFGNTPIIDHILSEGEQISRSSRPEVAQWIENELKACIDELPQNVDEESYGKPTRYMAEALLAKLYINWPVYTAQNVTYYDAANYRNDHLNDVVNLCDDIIRSGKFSISGGASGYLSKFWPNNGPQIKDFIYAIPYDCLYLQGFVYMRWRIWGRARDSYLGKLTNSPMGIFSISPEMSDRLLLLKNDDRKEHVLAGQIYMYDPSTYLKTSTPFLYNGEKVILSKTIRLYYKDNSGDHYVEWGSPVSDYPAECANLDVGYDNFSAWSQGYKSVKYITTPEEYANGRNQSNDLPIFRYADILLTKAEAIVRGAKSTNGQTAQSLFNEIREYVNAPKLSRSPSLEDIYDERAREFFDENWRRNDMIRFGHFEDEYGFHRKGFPTARFDKECRIFPIPQDVLNANPTWMQNDGY